MAGENTTTKYRVELQLRPAFECGRDELEAKSVDVMEALDEHTSDAVLGAAVNALFRERTLELDISIEAASLVELHRTLAEVFEVLEAHADLHAEDATSFLERAAPESELALA